MYILALKITPEALVKKLLDQFGKQGKKKGGKK
jgi:hypothetical protein